MKEKIDDIVYNLELGCIDWQEASKQLFALTDVRQQRELLEGFVDWFNANDKTQAILSERIEEYLKTL